MGDRDGPPLPRRGDAAFALPELSRQQDGGASTPVNADLVGSPARGRVTDYRGGRVDEEGIIDALEMRLPLEPCAMMICATWPAK